MITAAHPNPESTATMAVVGMFDGVHTGHRHLLAQLDREAAARQLRPLVITFPNHPLELIAPQRAPHLLTGTDEKLSLLHAALPTARLALLPFDHTLRQTSALSFLTLLRNRYNVRALLLGFNNRFGHDAPRDINEYQHLGLRAGVEIIRADELPGASSSSIRDLLAHGNLTQANTLLGRPFTLSGTVQSGRQIGRTIGFPTANIQPNTPRQQLPAGGVYACRATLSASSPQSHIWPAMVNIGSRPTIASNLPVTIEAHIIGLPPEADLYGHTVTLEFLARLRPEQHFPSLEALTTQLHHDRVATLAILQNSL